MSSVATSAPSISTRGREMPRSPIRKLAPFANAAKQRGVKVYHLNIGQPDLETPPPMREKLAAITERVYAYSPSEGTPDYLTSIHEYFRRRGIELARGEVIATTGGSEAIQFAFMATCDPGDEIVVVEPFYTNYRSFAAAAAVTLVPVLSRGEDGFHLPGRDVLEKAVGPKTRAIVLCNPNNPTGTVYGRDELVMVAELCRDRGLFLISDEVYQEFVYDGREAVSAHSLSGFESLVIVVDSLSKRYSACGIRLGSISSRNRDVMDASQRMAEGRLSPPGLAQRVAVGALDLGAEYFEGVVREYQHRRDILFEGLTKIPGVFLRKPEGAFYFVARLPVGDAEHFAQWLLTDFSHEGATVMVAPAPGFYATPGLGNDEVRIAYVLKAEDLGTSVRLLEEALRVYPGSRGFLDPPAPPTGDPGRR